MLYLIVGIYWLLFKYLWWIVKYFFISITTLVESLLNRAQNARGQGQQKAIPSVIANMNGWQYEEYVANRLKREGYHNIQVTSGSGDYGADIIAFDENGRKYCIQCKLYHSPVGVKAVQEIIAGKEYYGGNVAVVITNSTFTNAALEMARKTGVVLRENYT